MNNKKWFLPYLILAGAILAAPAVGQETPLTPAQMAKQEAERRDRILQLEMAPIETRIANNRVELNTCFGAFTIDQIISGDPHVNLGSRFWVLGPVPFLDAYVISPRRSSAKNTWTAGNYRALPDPLVPDWHSINNVPVKVPESHPQGMHSYHLRVTSWDSDDCPQYIELWHGKHSSTGIVMDDPGHAGATRD